MLLKGKTSEEEHLQTVILAVIQLPETERGYSANSATFWQCNEKYMRDLRWQVRVIH